MEKESSRIYTGTFYIVAGKIIYTQDTDENDAIDHYDLWSMVVSKVFTHVRDPEDREELKEAVYGADRGRVVFLGQQSKIGTPLSGQFSIYGTPGCRSHLNTLKTLFGLNKVDKLEQFSLHVDFHTDTHYKIQGRDERLINEFLRATKIDNAPLKIAGWLKGKPDPRGIKIFDL
jgi:hypothetical protein